MLLGKSYPRSLSSLSTSLPGSGGKSCGSRTSEGNNGQQGMEGGDGGMLHEEHS